MRLSDDDKHTHENSVAQTICRCECGCGEIVKNRFVKGHHWRGNNNPMSKENFTKEHREKLRKASQGQIHTVNHTRKIGDANRGQKRSEEAKKRMSKIAKNRAPFTEEHKKNLSKAKKGIVLAEEHKRHVSEALKGKLVGENNGMWLGGISFEPYCPKFNEGLKEEIREIFDRKCFLCGINE